MRTLSWICQCAAFIEPRLGTARLKTTMIYTHVLNRGGLGVQSPLDLLG